MFYVSKRQHVEKIMCCKIKEKNKTAITINCLKI